MRFLNSTPSPAQTNVALLIIRLVLGTVFIAHGAQKVFVFGMSGVGEGFGQMGIPFGAALGPLVSLVELFGGAAILLGLFTRVASAGIVGVMAGAIVFAHLPAGFFAPNGYEFPLMLLAAALALMITGPGAYSADAVLERRLTAASPAVSPASSTAGTRGARAA